MHSLPIIIAIVAIAALQVPGNWASGPSSKTYGNHWYKPKPCPQPAHPQNGTARLFRNNLVKYTCDPDYVLVGRSYRWCFYGKWMGAIPECRGNDRITRHKESYNKWMCYFVFFSCKNHQEMSRPWYAIIWTKRAAEYYCGLCCEVRLHVRLPIGEWRQPENLSSHWKMVRKAANV